MLNILEPCICTAQSFPVAGQSLSFVPHTINPFIIIRNIPKKILEDKAFKKTLEG